MSKCVFCEIVAGDAPAAVVKEWPAALAILPLNPVVKGHMLVLPKAHVNSFLVDPAITAMSAAYATELARGRQSNLITSAGEDATQSVHHLHWHIVPRRPGDGLTLPWTGQNRGDSSE